MWCSNVLLLTIFILFFLAVEWLRCVLCSYAFQNWVWPPKEHVIVSVYLSRCPYGSAPPGLQETHRTPGPLLQVCAVCTSHNSSWNSSTDNNRNSNLSASHRWQTDPINENVQNQTGTVSGFSLDKNAFKIATLQHLYYKYYIRKLNNLLRYIKFIHNNITCNLL